MGINTEEIKIRLEDLLRRKSDVYDFINQLSNVGELLFIGGAIRDLYFFSENHMPRDFDIVVSLKSPKEFSSIVNKYSHKKNRFGGYKLSVSGVEFDIWSLNKTWAFKTGKIDSDESNLTKSVYLNIDGIVYNYNKGVFYSDVFEKFLNTNEIDIELESNPCIELNLLRALRLKKKYETLDYSIDFSNQLKALFVEKVKSDRQQSFIQDLFSLQTSHYKDKYFSLSQLEEMIYKIN